MKNPPKNELVKKRKQFVVLVSLNARGLNERAFRFLYLQLWQKWKGPHNIGPFIFSGARSSAKRLPQRLNDGLGHSLRIPEEHHGVIPKKQLVIDTRIA